MNHNSSRAPTSAADMEKRYAELQASRTSQETRLGIGASQGPPASFSSSLTVGVPSGSGSAFPAAQAARSTLSNAEMEARMAALTSIRVPLFNTTVPSSVPTSILATDSRALASSSMSDMDARIAEMNRQRDSQNTLFANMVPTEGSGVTHVAPAPYSNNSYGSSYASGPPHPRPTQQNPTQTVGPWEQTTIQSDLSRRTTQQPQLQQQGNPQQQTLPRR